MLLNGIFVPVITPFQADQKVDPGLLKENIQKLNLTGVSGYMPLGSNGEFAYISDDEALDILNVVKKTAGKNKLVFAGTGRESVKNTVEFSKKAEEIGVDAVFVLTPHYFPKQMSSEVLEKYYCEVAEKISVPVILYSAPGYASGVNIEPELMARLAGIANISGMKDTSSKPVSEYASMLPERKDFSLLAGTMDKFYEGILSGATGGVLSSANYIPEICCSLYELLVKGKIDKAGELHRRLCGLAKKTIAQYGVAGVKAAMNILGYSCGVPRRPLQEVTGMALYEMTGNLKSGVEEINNFIKE